MTGLDIKRQNQAGHNMLDQCEAQDSTVTTGRTGLAGTRNDYTGTGKICEGLGRTNISIGNVRTGQEWVTLQNQT